MNRVYVVQSPMRRNVNNELVHMFDLTPAREYGNIEILLPSGPTLLASDSATHALREKLGAFTRSDHLLCLGDPVAIAAASAIVASINDGVVPLLVWDRQTRKYLSIRVNTHPRMN